MDFWARVLGSIALLVSAISMYISWRSFRRDRSDLRVSLNYRHQPEIGPTFHVRVVNHGRRPARVELIHVLFPTSPPLLESIAGGRKVNEGDPLDIWLPIYSRIEEPDIPINVRGAEAYDTLGNKYKYPGLSIYNRLEFHRLKKKINDMWSTANE